jgi:hypothetical protein
VTAAARTECGKVRREQLAAVAVRHRLDNWRKIAIALIDPMILAAMSPTKCAIAIVLGVACELMAVFNNRFYWARGKFGQGRPMPRWAGRLLFGLVGLLFILVGIRDFYLTN